MCSCLPSPRHDHMMKLAIRNPRPANIKAVDRPISYGTDHEECATVNEQANTHRGWVITTPRNQPPVTVGTLDPQVKAHPGAVRQDQRGCYHIVDPVQAEALPHHT